jgi:AcrR family transcriptional regulator
MHPSSKFSSSTLKGLQPDRSTRERLFDTAATLFWKKGYAATTTREIAAAVGIRQASLYHHVANKEDLLYRISVSALKQFLTEVESAVNTVAQPLERIRVLIHAHLDTLLKYQERNVTMMTELRALTPRHRNEVVALRESYAHFARSRLEDAQDAGVIRYDISARYLSLALLNMLNWAALWFRSDEALSMKELAGIFVKIFFTGAASAPARTAISLPDLASVKRAEPRPRKPRHRDNSTFERLLDAAVALFSRKGYTATSTREVAELVGIQKASIFYHIEDKEDLLYLICKSSLEQIRSDIDIAIREIQDPLERIRTLIRTHIESMLRDRDKHLTTLAEMHALSHQRLAQVVALRDAYENLVRTELHDAQRAAALRDDIDAKYLSLALLGLMNRVLRWYRRNGRLSPAQLGQLFAVIFLTGVQTAAD